jgi:hypothetical protein
VYMKEEEGQCEVLSTIRGNAVIGSSRIGGSRKAWSREGSSQ